MQKFLLKVLLSSLLANGLISTQAKAVEPLDYMTSSFAGVTGLTSRFHPENFIPETNTWIDSVDSQVSMSELQGSLGDGLSKIETGDLTGANGTTKFIQAVSGRTWHFARFPTTYNLSNSYTVYYVARYSNLDPAFRNRILTGVETPGYVRPDGMDPINITLGFHDGIIGNAFFINSWYSLDEPCWSGGQYICQASVGTVKTQTISDPGDWAIIGFTYNSEDPLDSSIRTNGSITGRNICCGYGNLEHQLGINIGFFADPEAANSEASDFEIADFLSFNKALTPSEQIGVEQELAKLYGISLSGVAPTAPIVLDASVGNNQLAIQWQEPESAGSGELYRYQVRANDPETGDSSYLDTGSPNARDYDFGNDGIFDLKPGKTFTLEVRAISTHGVGPWSPIRSVTYALESSPSQLQPPSTAPAPAPAQIDSRSAQSAASFKTNVKRGKTIKLPMFSKQGIALNYTSSKGCKVSKVYRTKSVKVGKKNKKVRTQVGWRLLGQKKRAVCQVRLAAPETSDFKAYSDLRQIRVR